MPAILLLAGKTKILAFVFKAGFETPSRLLAIQSDDKSPHSKKVRLDAPYGPVEMAGKNGYDDRTMNYLPTPIGPEGLVDETLIHEHFMQIALEEARAAFDEKEVPVGAVIVHEGHIVARAHNQREQLKDPTAHAEMIAITQAAESLGSWRLEGCALYVTLEPCPMCAGAILQARIPTVVYGATDPKAGAVDSLYQLLGDERLNHRVTNLVRGVLADRCGQILSEFFQAQRAMGKK